MWSYTPTNIGCSFTAPDQHAYSAIAARPVDTASETQRLALALEERFVCINAAGHPSPFTRHADPAHREPIDTLPTIRVSLDFGSVQHGAQLQEVHAFADLLRLSRSQGVPAFSAHRGYWRPTQVGRALLPVIGTLHSLSYARPSRHLAPYAQLAVDAYQHSGLHLVVQSGMQFPLDPGMGIGADLNPAIINLCNVFVQQLGERVNHKSADRADMAHRSRCDKVARDVRTYFSGLLKHHPNARVERLELSVQGQDFRIRDSHDDFKLIVNSTAQVLAALKQRFGQAIVGDVRKVACGPGGDYLVHLLLAVDGPTASELKGLHRVILDLWNELFPKQGIVVNCNDFEQLRYRGCGAPVREHESLSEQLDKAAIFLAETDRVIRTGFGKGHDGLLIGTVSGRSPS